MRAELDPLARSRNLNLSLHRGHRQNSMARVLQMQPSLGRLNSPRLEHEDAGDDLQAIRDTMLHFLEQDVFALQQLCRLSPGSAPAFIR